MNICLCRNYQSLVTVWCEIATWPTWRRQNLAVLGSTPFPGDSGAWKFQCFGWSEVERVWSSHTKVTYYVPFRSRIVLYNKHTYSQQRSYVMKPKEEIMFVQHKHAKSAFRTSCLHLSFAYAPMVKFLAMLRLRSIIMTAVVTPGRTASSWLNEYYGNTFTLTIHIYIYINSKSWHWTRSILNANFKSTMAMSAPFPNADNM